ncbi:hypothetical protein ACFFHH_05145 [Cytobacillus solani]|uniref:Group-specific protein n=1 Tax=Cytobacillus solani TaxID=1637975 RepID=A0A0Q3VFG1_9BACI|nr:hypothetical protein [Cytobacillus solani]KOP71275.1 hypothetical protein AMS60_24915 [Bacillus sp. FJAT-21945]KQL17783.1 hypothetical protein AN957_03580 [Cytobacillus solani]USK55592.1 hypothetical protein LIS82_03385 [Cytobacillus solani]
MLIAIILVIILTALAGVFTIVFMKRGDENYGSSSKRNTTNLSLIYIIVTIISFIALGFYIWFN